jgi:50S ribosomal protein L16 3-hydroxylase
LILCNTSRKETELNKNHEPLSLLGGLSAAAFMRQYWQKKPYVVRAAWVQNQTVIRRAELFALAQSDEVESRLIQRYAQENKDKSSGAGVDRGWRVKHGPIARSALPTLATPDWTLLVQGLDLHLDTAYELLQHFRFIPDARLDDVMVSYASDGGGVGPHTDSYDVFLIQLQGCRRWQIASPQPCQWIPDVPLKLLADFKPEQEWLLQPGDMLYLPPGWGHDGVAVGGDCMTASVGFRSPSRAELAASILQRMAEHLLEPSPGQPFWEQLYRDPRQPATSQPAALPDGLLEQASQVVSKVFNEPERWRRAMGEWLTEPKPHVWFDEPTQCWNADSGVTVDRRTRMMYDGAMIFINAESKVIADKDLETLQQLADKRSVGVDDIRGLSLATVAILKQWMASGWINPV